MLATVSCADLFAYERFTSLESVAGVYMNRISRASGPRWSWNWFRPLLDRYGDAVIFRGVASTAPIACNPNAEVAVHSAVPNKHVYAYVLALKSLLRFWSDFLAVVHDDGTLTDASVRFIRHHIPGVEIITRERADRLFDDRVKDEFVKQVRRSYTSYLKLFDPMFLGDGRRIIIVDTDVLFLDKPTEVIAWSDSGGIPWFHRSGTWVKTAVVEPRPIQSASVPVASEHVQSTVIRQLPEINAALNTDFSFVKGFNSGFIGYERDIISSDELRDLLCELHETVGDKLFNWGAEQTVHGMILCGRGAQALPSERYMVYTDIVGEKVADAAFVHFIGSFRYHRLTYLRHAASVVESLHMRGGGEL